jgi:3-methylfumaryl-CoA hydratase
VATVSGEGLARFVENWSPAPEVVHDDLTPTSAAHLAATLDVAETVEYGTALPLLWQWVYFNGWAPTAALGDDGHLREGRFLPPIPHRRRMFAGGRVEVNAPLVLGVPAQRHSHVTAVIPKTGRSGSMLFVTVRQEFHQNGELMLVEEQDVVYRSGDGAAPRAHERSTRPFVEPGVSGSMRPVTTALLLFRFSALTANAHRIHYDQPYATGVEGYPGLVVHGPLLAIYMAGLLPTMADGRTVKRFEYRFLRPVFVGDPIEVAGSVDGNSVSVKVVGSSGVEHATGRAVVN